MKIAFPFKLPLLLDGGTGTSLMEAGLPAGASADRWSLENPDKLADIQKAFVRAGSDAVLTPTFGANPFNMRLHKIKDDPADFNRRLVEITVWAVGGRALIGGDMGPSGRIPAPMGDLDYQELINGFSLQARALREAGVDFIMVETMMSLAELRAAVLGALSTGLPVMASLTLTEAGTTIFGTSPLAALLTMQRLGVSAFGFNCGNGPDNILPVLQELAPHARIPLLAKPNAGLPEEGVYSIGPGQMGQAVKPLMEAGAAILGGCCGSTPGHLAAIRRMLDQSPMPPRPPLAESRGDLLAGESFVHILTEPPDIRSALPCGDGLADALADAADEGGVACVRLESGEDSLAFAEAAALSPAPVCLLCDSEEVLGRALARYIGIAAVSRQSGIPPEALRRLASGYGAVLV